MDNPGAIDSHDLVDLGYGGGTAVLAGATGRTVSSVKGDCRGGKTRYPRERQGGEAALVQGFYLQVPIALARIAGNLARPGAEFGAAMANVQAVAR